ncbi:MAG: response regulator [Oscillospiraceae bacterium]|jgi:signal transduction histidine kinase/CheY-like chemotaxis protein|nr:response regulator [Oscillospiraceae bacterium]
MPGIRLLLKKARTIRLPYLQVLFIFVAFGLMVLLSYIYVSNIEHKNLLKNADNALRNTQVHIESDLREMETSLVIISETVRGMIFNGEDADKVGKYMGQISDSLIRDDKYAANMSAVYGYFDVFGGEFISGVDWIQPGGFNPKSRPWYEAAVEADGNVGVTEPYINMITNESTFTYSRRIFDDSGEPLGVICLDINLDRVKSYAVAANFTEDSYGILMNRNLEVIAHPIDSYLGVSIYKMNNGEAIANDVLEGKGFAIEGEAYSYKQERCAMFYTRLENGWYLFILAPYDQYYKSTREMAVVLSSMGLLLASGLGAILVFVTVSRNNAERYSKMMFEAMPFPCMLWRQDIRPEECNNASLEMFGISDKSEFFRRFENFSPEFQPDGTPSYEKGNAYFKKAIEGEHCVFEWIHQKASGEPIPCEVTFVRLAYKREYVIISYLRDLRRLRAAQEKIREADERNRLMLDATPLCTNFWNSRGENIDCNQEAVNLFGVSSKQEYLERFHEFSPEFQPDGENSRKKSAEFVKEAFEKGAARFEWTHKNAKGELIPCEITLVRVKYDGDYVVLGYARDLRELKAMLKEIRRVEVAEESNRAKSKFIARMSHEMRTPMNAILGIAEIRLQDETLSYNAKEAWTRVYNSGYTLLRIINDVLDLSKIESGKLELVLERYDIPSLINDTVYLNLTRIESKQVEFVLDVDENLPSELYGDELRIKQILNNLLSNAFKYTDEGQVTLSITMESEAMSHMTTLVFTVSDTGPGMSDEQVRQIFDEYSRFNIEANRMTEGTGLGMNITHQLVSMMNGTISVNSELGKGSEFTVRIPQENIGSGIIGKKLAENLRKLRVRHVTQMKRAHITRDPMPYGSVLLVDDVGTNIYVAQGLLAPYELKVDTALSGFEAIEKIKSGNVYDIIFMDHMMPKMDGVEAAGIIRDLGYERPIVALTANAVAGQAEIFLDSGFDDYISKPIDIRQLNTTLNRLVRDRYPAEVVEAARAKREKEQRRTVEPPDENRIDPVMLELFAKDAEKAIGILESVLLDQDLDGESVNLYTVNVHGMRNALVNIGERELSDVALKLERAGRDRDTAMILDATPAFVIALKSVIEKVKSLKGDEDYVDVKNEDAALLKKELSLIKAACSNYDITTATDAMNRLNKITWSRQTSELLKTVNEHLLNSDFEKAEEACGDVNSE